MFPTAPNFRLLFFVFYLLIFDFCCAYQSPYSRTSTVFSRQNETTLTSPVTVTTTEKITTDVGTFIQTCIITLTPIVVSGVDMVREDKTCMVMPDDGDSSAVPPATSTSSSDSLSSTSTVSPPTSTSTPPPDGGVSSSTTDGLSITSLPLSTGVPSNTVPPDFTITNLPPASSGSVPPPVVSITLTSVPRPDVTNSVVSLPSDTNTGSDAPSSAPNPVATPQPDNTDSPTVVSPPPSSTPLSLPESSSSSSSAVFPTASPETAGAAAPFDPPGKKLEVLPIGLGVFAGVSVIALLVVGIVTYERTKHRRNFRRRRQEEANLNRMGYGTV